jgi:hypothetical protein
MLERGRPPSGVQYSTVMAFVQHLEFEVPGDFAEIEFNRKLCENTHLLPKMGDAECESMSMTTIVGSHCNFVSRCFYFGVECGHAEHANGEGCMNLSYLRDVDPPWAKAVEEGSLTTILSHHIRTKDPAGMLAIMQADNLKHGANLVEHSLQLIRRLVNICHIEEAVSSTVRKTIVCRRFMSTVGTDDASMVDDLYTFAYRLGLSDALADLEEFRTCYMKDGKRDVESTFLAKVASLPLGFQTLATALVKCQLTCPEHAMVKCVCKFVHAGEVEQLREGKPNHVKAKACDAFLQGFRSTYSAQLVMVGMDVKTELLARLDSQAARILLGKKCKFSTFGELGFNLHDMLCMHVASGTMPQCTYSNAVGSGLRPDDTAVASGLRPGDEECASNQMVKYSGGKVELVHVLQERGVVPGAHMVAKHSAFEFPDGCVVEVKAIGEYGVKAVKVAIEGQASDGKVACCAL